MQIYGVYKDGVLQKFSYEQNTPFYMTLLGAQRAIQSQTNIRSLPDELMDAPQEEQQAYLNKERARYTIKAFELRGE